MLVFGTLRYVIIMLFLGSPLWDTSYCVTTKLFQVPKNRILNVRNMWFTATFYLRTEIIFALKLRYLYVQCCYVFLMTLELRHILVRLNCVVKLCYKMVIF